MYDSPFEPAEVLHTTFRCMRFSKERRYQRGTLCPRIAVRADVVWGPQVGRMLVSGGALREAARGRGRAAELLHCVGDLLWALAPGRPVPNVGFTGEDVQPWSDGGCGNASSPLGTPFPRAACRSLGSVSSCIRQDPQGHLHRAASL